jgi:hypothetical protein
MSERYRFRPDDLVICINDTPPFAGAPMGALCKGTIYTVAHVGQEWSGEEFLGLEEIDPVPGFYGYMAWRFRPVDDHRLDVFRVALRTAPTRKGVVVDAVEGCRP